MTTIDAFLRGYLESCRPRPGRKPSEATRAKYEQIKALREAGKQWNVIAMMLGYENDRSAANHYRALRHRYEPPSSS